jgi:hypothetical protein
MKLRITRTPCSCGRAMTLTNVRRPLEWRCNTCDSSYRDAIERSGIPRAFLGAKVEEMISNEFNGPLIRVLSYMKSHYYCPVITVLVGPTGSGKTEFACLIAKTLLFYAPLPLPSVRYTTVEDLLETARLSKDYNHPQRHALAEELNDLANARVLILDELNRDQYSTAQKARIHELIQSRAAQERRTIVTTTLTQAELGSILRPDTVSRLRTAKWYCPGAIDMRTRA